MVSFAKTLQWSKQLVSFCVVSLRWAKLRLKTHIFARQTHICAGIWDEQNSWFKTRYFVHCKCNSPTMLPLEPNTSTEQAFTSSPVFRRANDPRIPFLQGFKLKTQHRKLSPSQSDSETSSFSFAVFTEIHFLGRLCVLSFLWSVSANLNRNLAWPPELLINEGINSRFLVAVACIRFARVGEASW